MKRLLAMLMVIVMMVGMVPTASAAPNNSYDHIDVRQHGPQITMTSQVVNIVTGDVISSTKQTIECEVTAVKSVTYTQLSGQTGEKTWTWNNLASDGNNYEFRQMDLTLSTNLDYSYATIVVDLVGANGKTYEDVVFTFGPDGCKQAVVDCDGYTRGGSVGLDFKLGLNNNASVVYTEWVIPVTKIWDDNNDQDGIRPDSIDVILYADGVEMERATLNADNNWYYLFEHEADMSADESHHIVYTVDEASVPTGYTKSVNGFTITNTYVPETVSKTVTKIWDDADNQDGLRPDVITVELMANGSKVGEAVLNEENDWTYTFTNLPKNAAGVEIVYTAVETEVPDGYTKSENGLTITNTHTPETVEVSGSKTWADDNNRDNVRPESIIINLLADGEKVASKTVTAADGWKWSFTNLPKYAAGKEIVYTITENAVAGYTAKVDGYNVTNTHTPETITISGAKTWADNGNQDGKRPASITIRLLADGVELTSKTVTAADGWKWSFTDLYKYADGKEIVYTITEDAVADYTSQVDGYNVTNTHEIEKTSVSGSKTWVDNNDQDGKRPGSITINLLADGVKVDSVEVTEADGWAWTFTDLDKYADGKEIVYTITEDAVADYTTKVDGYNVTNTHTPETTSISVSKVWDDKDDQAGFRPAAVTVSLMNGDTVVETIQLNESNSWAYTFSNLPVYAGGQKITYTVVEAEVEHYTAAITGSAEEGYVITNTHVPTTVNVEGKKTWEDNNDQDGMRPESITINLLADGEKVDSVEVTEADGWAWAFNDLPEYANGEKITYTITEDAVDEYTSEVDGYNVTNTHETEKTSVSGSKTWEDNDDQDGKRPTSITINLLANGEKVKSVKVTADDDWAWSFTDLDKYAAGVEIVYTITEDAVADYTSEVDGYNVTNTHEIEKTEVSGSKTWADNNNQDGIRPDSITIRLLADGEEVDSKTVTAENGWAWSFTDLDKYANGEEIVYTITEDAVADYTTKVDGYNVTNTHTPETIEITVTKEWDDADDQDGIRPNAVSITLWANDVEKETVELKDKLIGTDWSHTFKDLPKYEAGEEIVYTITEDAVEGYEAEIDDNEDGTVTVTNTHEPEKTSVSVTKDWDDADNQDGIRPEEITVYLMNGKETVQEAVLNEENDWTYEFTDLDKYSKGKVIDYTVEEAAVDGYKAKITGTLEDGYVITNTHTPEVIDIGITKTWDDADDQDGLRPDSVTVNLLANGEKVASAKVKAGLFSFFTGEWTYTFKDLPKYEDGEEIVYTITEDAVAGYEAEIDGYVITNVHVPETTEMSVVKVWDDENNKYETRSEKVKITLYANGKSTGKTVTLSESNNWYDVFEDLPKYEDGTEIKYTVKEASLDLYKATYAYVGTKAVVTNTLSEIPVTGDHSGVPTYFTFMGISAVAIAALVLLNKKKRRA